MGILIDSGFFLGILHFKDPYADRAENIFKEMSTGKYGLVYTTPYVISEAATLLLVRTRNNYDLIENFYDILYGENKFIRILEWTREMEQKSWILFKKHNKIVKEKKKYLSFVDASNIVYCREYKIDKIAAFDGDFDGYLNRIN
jgi:uncharacterized protein